MNTAITDPYKDLAGLEPVMPATGQTWIKVEDLSYRAGCRL